MSHWKNISLSLENYDLNKAFQILSYLDVIAVTIQDKRILKESDWFDDPKNPSRIKCETHKIILLVDIEFSTKKLITDVKSILGLTQEPSYHEEIFEDQDWVAYTQSMFKEIRISDSLRIIPSWIKDENFKGNTISIEPGSGFGTGSHPTTKLCLKWIDKKLKRNMKILDYGSGSGILSITANKIYNCKVTGVEIDPLAIKNAYFNNILNKVDIKYFLPKNFIFQNRYDIVMSNILASILISLSNDFKIFTKSEILLSGILINQVESIIDKYDEWINLKLIDEMEGWCLLHGNLNS